MGDSSIYSVCKEDGAYMILRYAVFIGISIVVSVINGLVNILLRKMSVFQRYKNITAMHSSIMIKIFLAIFVNIGILIIVINSNFTTSISNTFTIASRKWQYLVGVPILTLMMTNIAITMFYAFMIHMQFSIKKLIC